MIFALTSLLVASLAAADANPLIDYLRLAGARQVRTSERNFAIASPKLFKGKWDSISMNGNQATFYGHNCNWVSKDARSLSAEEKLLLDGAKSQLLKLDANLRDGGQLAMAQFWGSYANILPAASDVAQIKSRLFSLDAIDADDFSVFMEAFPSHLNRVFVSEDLVTLVFEDGRVDMQPVGCLEPEKRKFFEQFSESILEARRTFDSFERRLNELREEPVEPAPIGSESPNRVQPDRIDILLLERAHAMESLSRKFQMAMRGLSLSKKS